MRRWGVSVLLRLRAAALVTASRAVARGRLRRARRLMRADAWLACLGARLEPEGHPDE